MRLFIDARFYGLEHTGLGRYTKNVLDYLPKLVKYDATILVHPKYKNVKFGNWQVITSSVRPYSWAEQVVVPYLVARSHTSLYLGFHFNIPLLLSVPFVTVIHDLIKSHFVGSDTTTRSPWLYKLKRLGYTLTMRRCVHRARSLIVPTNTVKNEILATYFIEPSRIQVISEAVDPNILKPSKYQVPFTNYFLYTGNSYPHKNLLTLLKAMETRQENLVMVSKRTPYLTKILSSVSAGLKSRIYIIEWTTDQELAGLYRYALATVCPSLMEGYGLPGVESLALGTPVVASNIPVYREVYGSHALSFEPKSSDDLVRALSVILTWPRKAITPPRTWRDVAESIAEVIE